MIKRLLFALLIGLGLACQQQTIPERIIESVAIVNASSGVVVYADQDRALVLTAFHVLADGMGDDKCCKCGYNATVSYEYITNDQGVFNDALETYTVVSADYDQKMNIAVVEIHPKRLLSTARIARWSPRLGDSIWLGSNPHYNFRSLKRGTVGSLLRIKSQKPVIEVSGGIIFGSSGGGAFNESGELFGVIQSVDQVKTDYCQTVYDDKGKEAGEECVHVPMFDWGFVSQTYTIRNFLMNGPYRQYFDYLK